MDRTVARTPTSQSQPSSSWLKLYACLTQWRRNARTRAQLAQLNEQQLADAGISEAQRQQELARPFWR